MEWTIKPVLAISNQNLPNGNMLCLKLLVTAMSDKQNLEKLNEFEEWRNAKPEEI